MLLIAVMTMYYSPLTQVSCVIIHKSSHHLHVTFRIGASDNFVTTALQMGLEKRKRIKISFTPSLRKVNYKLSATKLVETLNVLPT